MVASHTVSIDSVIFGDTLVVVEAAAELVNVVAAATGFSVNMYLTLGSDCSYRLILFYDAHSCFVVGTSEPKEVGAVLKEMPPQLAVVLDSSEPFVHPFVDFVAGRVDVEVVIVVDKGIVVVGIVVVVAVAVT